MVQAPAKPITIAEFLAMPETKPASELINGLIIPKPMPQGRHSTIQGELTSVINALLKPSRTAWAFPELRCTFGDRSIIPDVTVFTWAHIPTNEDGTIADRILIAPDWTIEILSPEQSTSRVTSNILHCLSHGTQLGWLIDPAEKMIFTYGSIGSVSPVENRVTQCFESVDDLIPVPIFAQGLQLTLGRIFDWLQVN
jgi:Uma2 family endonuclease